MIKYIVLLPLLVVAGFAAVTPKPGTRGTLPDTKEGEVSKEDLILILLGQLKQDVSELKGDVTELKTDVIEMKGDISELKGTTNSLETAVGGLVIKVSNLETSANGRLN